MVKKEKNQHQINLTWTDTTAVEPAFLGTPPPNVQNQAGTLDVKVFSRKIKNMEQSPHNILFRTHTYEIRITPDDAFNNWAGARSKFFVELQLLQYQNDNSAKEFYVCEGRAIDFTFSQEAKHWSINLAWLETKQMKIGWKGTFYFKIVIFKKESDVYKRVAEKISSYFQILSKPEVHIKQMQEKQAAVASSSGFTPTPVSTSPAKLKKPTGLAGLLAAPSSPTQTESAKKRKRKETAKSSASSPKSKKQKGAVSNNMFFEESEEAQAKSPQLFDSESLYADETLNDSAESCPSPSITFLDLPHASAITAPSVFPSSPSTTTTSAHLKFLASPSRNSSRPCSQEANNGSKTPASSGLLYFNFSPFSSQEKREELHVPGALEFDTNGTRIFPLSQSQ